MTNLLGFNNSPGLVKVMKSWLAGHVASMAEFMQNFGAGTYSKPDIWKKREGARMLIKLVWVAIYILFLLPSKYFDVWLVNYFF